MITGKEQAFAGPSDTGYQPGMDIRTWMATQIKVAYIIRGGTTREQRDQWAVEETDSLIEQLNKQPAP